MDHWETWQLWGADAWVVQVLHFGYQVPFRFLPPLSHVPLPLPSYSPSSIRGLALTAEVSDLLAKEAIELAPPSPGFYSRLFVTSKVTGGWRPVVDLSRLNGFVDVSHFHMETTQTVLQSLREGDCLVSLDLQDAYLQVPVHPASRRYLRFCVGVSVYQFRALCFGLSTAPQVFTRIMAPVSAIMHRHGFWILRYLDDWLVLASTFQESVRARDFLLWLCQRLGIRVNLPKSSLTPMQTQDYLGITIQTIPLRVFPTLKRIQKLSLLLQDFLSTWSHPVSVWRQLLGIMSSMSALVPDSRLRMRALQIRLNVAGRLQLDDFLVEWDSDCHPDLLWWSDVSHLQVSMPLGESLPDLCLFTDASDIGWGASLGDVHLSGSWSPLSSRFSINHRELLAVLLALRGFLPSLCGRVVAVFSDNTTALVHLKKQGGTRSVTLNTVAQSVLRFCKEFHIQLLPQFIPGKMNVLADSLSRKNQVIGSEWTLCAEAFHHLLRLWPATIDLFATSVNRRLPVYFSPMVDLQSAGTDAMLQCWDGLQAYAFPPFGLLSQVLAKARQQRVGVDVDSSVLATTCLVPVPSGASGGDSLLPAMTEGSSQTAPLPSLSPEPLRTSADCLAYLQRSARHSGFSSAVARQLTLCRRHSTRLNYQAKWPVYRAWCHRHGHSVSRPSVSKVADFLLYLRRSLSLSLTLPSLLIVRCSVVSFVLFS